MSSTLAVSVHVRATSTVDWHGSKNKHEATRRALDLVRRSSRGSKRIDDYLVISRRERSRKTAVRARKVRNRDADSRAIRRYPSTSPCLASVAVLDRQSVRRAASQGPDRSDSCDGQEGIQTGRRQATRQWTCRVDSPRRSQSWREQIQSANSSAALRVLSCNGLRRRNPREDEFIQAVCEVARSVFPLIESNADYKECEVSSNA